VYSWSAHNWRGGEAWLVATGAFTARLMSYLIAYGIIRLHKLPWWDVEDVNGLAWVVLWTF
jgi:hypothetical protein